MKKFWKIFGISVGSLLGVLTVAIAVVCNVVFSSGKLTPIVRDNIPKFVSCEVSLDTVDLTFFSTFPHLSLRIKNVNVVNPLAGAPSDTVAAIGVLDASVNLWALVAERRLVLNRFCFDNGRANLYVDSAGRANYDILIASDSEPDKDTTQSNGFLKFVEISTLDINNFCASYTDRTAGIDARIDNFGSKINGALQKGKGQVYTNFSANEIVARIASDNVYARINDLDIDVNGMMDDTKFDGSIAIVMPGVTFASNTDTLTRNLRIDFALPAGIDFDEQRIVFHDAMIAANGNELKLNGPMSLKGKTVYSDLDIKSNSWDIEELRRLIPAAYAGAYSNLTAKGKLNIEGSVTGALHKDSTRLLLPLLRARVTLSEGYLKYPDIIPFDFSDITVQADARLNLNKDSVSSAGITRFETRTGTNRISAAGIVENITKRPVGKLRFVCDLNLPELKPIVPDNLNLDMTGRVKTDLATVIALDDLKARRLEKFKVRGEVKYSDLDILLNDSIHINDQTGALKIVLPIDSADRNKPTDIMMAAIDGTDMTINMAGTLNTRLQRPNITVRLSNPFDTTRIPNASVRFEIGRVTGTASDTITFDIINPIGGGEIGHTKKRLKRPRLEIGYKSDALTARIGSLAEINTEFIAVKAQTRYNHKAELPFLKYNPRFNINFNQGEIHYASLPEIKIPAIKFKFVPNDIEIEKSHIQIGNSDFSLSGKVTNLRKYIRKKGLLEGELNFTSKQTDVTELLGIFSGFGSETATQPADTAAAKPFIVPKGIDITFNTTIEHAIFRHAEMDTIGGRITVNNGTIVAEHMGFTTEAAEMQVSGIYRTEHPDSIFAGLDFHLLDVDIKKLIDMIPLVDSIVPMLKSFEGNAEMHIAAQTYLDHLMQPIIPSIRAAASIEGKNLVLLDSKTFSTIAKMLMFSKQRRNIVDSLSIEAVIDSGAITLYPFVISLGKWKAVIAGDHNIGNDFKYHISLIDNPLALKLGLDVKGTVDDVKFDLVPCKYKNLYRPGKKGEMHREMLENKRLISDALKKRVK